MNGIRKLYLVLIFFTNLSFSGWAQIKQLSPQAQISVITCGSGTDLYTAFGHSAFRVTDPAQRLDVVYNYGTFDFDPPGFYVDFAKGKLDYKLSKQDYPRFLFTYELEQRWVKEQQLQLSLEQKNKLYSFLEKNNLPQNQEYPYDFFYDNCATKIKDVLQLVLGSDLVYDASYIDTPNTFRALIYQNVPTNSWSALGIDIALGAVIDKEASPEQHMFLPDYVRLQMAEATLDNNPLIRKENDLLNVNAPAKETLFFATPLFWMLLALVLIGGCTWRDYKNNSRSRWLDFILFLSTGIIGLLIVFLWFFTNHTATVSNFNMLWAFVPNLVLAFFLLGKKPLSSWTKKYIGLLLGLLVLIFVLWVMKIQVFNIVLLPLFLAFGIRYTFLAFFFKQAHTAPTL